MQLYPMKLITIVGEEILRDQLVRKVREAGAKGCSYTSTQGVGSHEARHNDVFSANFELKVVCPEKVADVVMISVGRALFRKIRDRRLDQRRRSRPPRSFCQCVAARGEARIERP